MQRSDGPVYLISDADALAALHAADLSGAAVHSPSLGAGDRHGLCATIGNGTPIGGECRGADILRSMDGAGDFDRHRPLYRIALNDARGTELYVSSDDGRSRAGYDAAPARLELCRQYRALDLSDGAAQPPGDMEPAGVVAVALGADRRQRRHRHRHAAAWRGRIAACASPYRGWQAWHHWLGLCCMLFVLTWIFSGWLSMDDGTAVLDRQADGAEIAAVAGSPDWNVLPRDELAADRSANHRSRMVRLRRADLPAERTALGVQHMNPRSRRSRPPLRPARAFLSTRK